MTAALSTDCCLQHRRTPGFVAGRATRAGGYTVLELLITLATAAVLAAVAVPSFGAIMRHNRLAAANNEFMSALYLLRSEAAKRNRIVKMCRIRDPAAPRCDTAADGGWHTGWAIWVDVDSSGQIDDGELVIDAHGRFGSNLVLTGNSTVADRFAFQSSGATAGVSNGTFTVCVPNSPRKRQIIVSRAGRIRTRDLDSDGTC